MHRNIAINTLCLEPAPLAVQVDRIARIGARAITPDVTRFDDGEAGRAARMIRDAGLQVAALTHRSFSFIEAPDIADARQRLMQTIDLADAIGAPAIVLTTGPRGPLSWPEAAARFADAIAPCVDHARSPAIRLAIEPTSHLYADASMVHRLKDCADLARMAGLAVAVDLFACWFDSDIDDAIAAAAPATALVQVSDYVAGDRALPCRAIPGDGMVPLDRLMHGIVRAGFDGWFDLEIIGPRLPDSGTDAGLVRAGTALGRILETAGLAAD